MASDRPAYTAGDILRFLESLGWKRVAGTEVAGSHMTLARAGVERDWTLMDFDVPVREIMLGYIRNAYQLGPEDLKESPPA